jgi:thiol-disulfide isomerase/thioredoxin
MTKTVAAMRARQGQQRQQRQRPAMTMIGKEAPQFSVTTTDGKQLSVGGKREKPQVVFCWASWCGYCKRALPGIESLHQKYKDKGVDVIALNLDARGEGGRARTEEQTMQIYENLKLTLPMTMTTDSNDTQKIGAAYKARSFPTLFVIGGSGEVESVHIGAKQGLEETVGAELELLLAGKTRADFP